MSDVIEFANLRDANVARQDAWCPDQMPDLSFRGNELAGEVGEVCNVIKKLERERLGWRGSRDTVEHLAEELADVVICADLVAITAGIDLEAAVAAKFNATSELVGLPQRLKPIDDFEICHRVMHLKRGTTYRVLGEAWVQIAQPENYSDIESTPFTLYQGEADGVFWVRPSAEFADGRFEIIGAADGGLDINDALRDVIAERTRQVRGEGWTAEHDDSHANGEMVEAAACYALSAAEQDRLLAKGETLPEAFLPGAWPWAPEWWKPGDARRMLVKAAALILAEIERLDRKADRETPRG